MPLKVQSGKTGKTYDMPWTLPEDPSNDEIDKFISSQEGGRINEPTPVAPVKPIPTTLGGRLKADADSRMSNFEALGKGSFKDNFLKPAIPKFDTNDISLATDSYPIRASKELFNTFISDASSPAAVAGEVLGGKAIKALTPYLGKMLPFLNKGGNGADIGIPGSGPVKVNSPVGQIQPTVKPGLISPAESRVNPPVIPNNTGIKPAIPASVGNDIPGKGILQKLDLLAPEQPLTKAEVTNAAIVKEGLSAKAGPKPVKLVSKVRPQADGTVDLLNPDQTTIEEMLSKGFEPTGEINPDNSIKLVKSVNAVPTGPQPVKPLTAPPDINSPSFPGGGNNGGIPPSNTIPPSGGSPTGPVNPVMPTPPAKKFGLVTRIGTNLKTAGTGLDLSAPLRQGRALMHKKEFYKALPDMFRAAKSEDGYRKLMDDIVAHPDYEDAKKAKLSLMNLGDDLSDREEAIMGSMVEKIPGIGRLYRGSNRAYSGFLNKLRMDTYSSLMDDARKAGSKVDSEEVADLVNVLTGRGKLKFGDIDAEGAAPLLNATFFSPRFLSSRVKLLTSPISYANADPFVRKEALKGFAALVSSQATLLGLAYSAGNKVEWNPTSSDFMKFRSGNSRIDTNAGLQQLFVLGSRLASGKTKSSMTGRTSKLDSGKFGGPTSGSVVGRFLTSKESPLVGLVSELWTGKDFLGEKQGMSEAILKRVTPMILQDAYDLSQDDPKNAWLLAPAVFGASVQTYKKKRK